MPPTEYTLLTDPRQQSRIRGRYSADMEALAALGFRQLCFYVEQLGSFSAVVQLPMLVLMLARREVLVLRPPLRLAAGLLLLHHTDPPAIALPMGMGVKPSTGFADPTILITCTFSSHALPRPGSQIMKIVTSEGIHEAWRLHRDRVWELERGGKSPIPQVSFESYVALSRIEEDMSQYLVSAF